MGIVIDQELIRRLNEAGANKLQAAHDRSMGHVLRHYHEKSRDAEVARLHAIQLELDKSEH